MEELATFAAGCFWHVEEAFSKIPGVISTKVGYSGGKLQNPRYEQVKTGETGHAESVQVTFDPEKVSYEKLLNVFWNEHDPTSLNKQGADIGTQYRAVIFYHNQKQKELAEKSKRRLQKNLEKPIVTEIVPAKKFWPAEEYHQKYLFKNKNTYCEV